MQPLSQRDDRTGRGFQAPVARATSRRGFRIDLERWIYTLPNGALSLFLVTLLGFTGCASRSTSTSEVPRISGPMVEAGKVDLNDPTPVRIQAQEQIPAFTETEHVTTAKAAAVNALSVPKPNAPPEEAPIEISEGVAALADLAQSGVNTEVMLAFVDTHEGSFDMDSGAIVYLVDLGIPENVITKMIRKGAGENATADVADLESKLSEALVVNPTETPATESAAENQATGQPSQETAAIVPDAPGAAIEAAPSFQPGQTPGPTPAPVEVAKSEPVPTAVFQSSLSPYGTWVDIPGYGLCWQPTAALVNPGWQPYFDNGSWYSTSSGWYWHSNYSWGWAPFHYGRWHRHPARGWYWIPGSTWGPAWVTWRYSDAYVGWAPLPPRAYYYDGLGLRFSSISVGIGFDFGLSYVDYGFVPYRYFCGPSPWRHRLPHARVTQVYNQTTIINNYTEAPDHTIIHNGPSRVTGRPFRGDAQVRTASLRSLPTNNSEQARPGQIQRRGGEAVIYRPDLRTMEARRAVSDRREQLKVPGGVVGETGARGTARSLSQEGRGSELRPVQRRESGTRRTALPARPEGTASSSTFDRNAPVRRTPSATAGANSNRGLSTIGRPTPLQLRDRDRRDALRTIDGSSQPSAVVPSSRATRPELSAPNLINRSPARLPDRNPQTIRREPLLTPGALSDRNNTRTPARAPFGEIRNRTGSPYTPSPRPTLPDRSAQPFQPRVPNQIAPARQAPPPASSGFRSVPLRQGPPPQIISPSQLTPSPRSPSRSGSSRSERKPN